MTKKEIIKDFLSKNLSLLEYDSGGGFFPELPDYDLYAYDYLNFAETNLSEYYDTEIESVKTERLISCVSNLKRALECQIDSVLHIFNIDDIFNKKGLGLNKKLQFLEETGIFRSKSIERLIKIRNRIEHKYVNPSIHDLETLYDLVSSFVAILSNVINFSKNIEIDLSSLDEDVNCTFTITYNREKAMFIIKIDNNPDKHLLKCSIDDFDDFAFCFKVAYLLHLRDTFASDKLILEKLNS